MCDLIHVRSHQALPTSGFVYIYILGMRLIKGVQLRPKVAYIG